MEQPGQPEGDKESWRNYYQRSKYIMATLIEQHCDPNKYFPACVQGIAGNLTPLQVAVLTNEWELVNLLLKYGANSYPPSPCMLMRHVLDGRPGGKKRLAWAVSQNKTVDRPPRLCPCFSGKSLSECHMQRQPYPPEFLCMCGSKKIHDRCCKKRDVPCHEIWDEEGQWIQPSRQIIIPTGIGFC